VLGRIRRELIDSSSDPVQRVNRGRDFNGARWVRFSVSAEQDRERLEGVAYFVGRGRVGSRQVLPSGGDSTLGRFRPSAPHSPQTESSIGAGTDPGAGFGHEPLRVLPDRIRLVDRLLDPRAASSGCRGRVGSARLGPERTAPGRRCTRAASEQPPDEEAEQNPDDDAEPEAREEAAEECSTREGPGFAARRAGDVTGCFCTCSVGGLLVMVVRGGRVVVRRTRHRHWRNLLRVGLLPPVPFTLLVAAGLAEKPSAHGWPQTLGPMCGRGPVSARCGVVVRDRTMFKAGKSCKPVDGGKRSDSLPRGVRHRYAKVLRECPWSRVRRGR
jgi:hypothetical protein